MRILIAEDEVSIARAIKVMLEKQKYAVDLVHNGREALEYIEQYAYDIILLDIFMPEKDGLTVLKEIRGRGMNTPVLLLTAKGEVEDRVAGLNAGADDYLPKPFAAAELLARVQALGRRSSVYTPAVVSFGNTALDAGQFTLSVKEKSVRLNNKEFQLMQLFLSNPHQVFSTDHLMQKVWSADSEAGIDVVWTYIGFLRKKLRLLCADIEIKTIRGAGYALEERSC